MHESYRGLSDFLQYGKVDGLHHAFTDPKSENVAVLYRNGYLRACREALEARFPTVVSVMGSSEFRFACYAYTRQCPPTQRTLTGYGTDFPDWLAHYERAQHSPAWVGLAQLDGAWLDCLYGLDEEPLTALQLNERIQSGSSVPISPRLPRNACLVPLQYPVFDAWVAARQGHTLQEQTSHEYAAVPDNEYVLFWRPDMTVLSRQLATWEVDFYRMFMATDSLEQSAGCFQPPKTEKEDAPISLEQYFAQLIEAGLLTFGD